MKNPARGGGRWVDIAPERLPAWVNAFADRHPDVTAEITGSDAVTFSSADGASAECHVPFPPLEPGIPHGPPTATAEYARLIAGHAQAARTVGVLLVRLGGYAAGVFTGEPPRLAASKVGSRLVHGRSAAGGRSQHRFARRREKQAAEAMSAAADNAAAVFGRFGDRLDAVVLGGDRRAVAALRTDTRLGPYFALATDRFLTVPDPRLAVLTDTPRMFRAIKVRLTEPS
ncbi:MAG TPA: acVLRF1 family peptidyl-tRNA hydrolase [Streptosporangiaceae bacterium]|nr:acVLRF1 family peptidyl-tRNA hydrolase [Streptosporangiaceae bacterium]